MSTEAEWLWTRVNEKMLASYVAPQLVSQALGEVSPETYRQIYWDDDHVVDAVTAASYDATEPLPDERQLTDFDLLHDRPQLARRIYDRLRSRNPSYQLEQIGLRDDQQPIRSPAQVLGSVAMPGEGTCLDLALVYAGACLHRNLLPLVVVFSDHAITMVATNHDRRDVDGYRAEDAAFHNGVATDGNRVRALVTEGKTHVAIECTGFAVSHSLSGRDKNGFLSFDQAVEAGTTAFEARQFSFAIDPFWLHRKGIEPLHQNRDLSHPTERALIGAKRTDVLVHAVAEYSPALLRLGSPGELDSLNQALEEVAKTYDIVRDVTTRWIAAGIGGGGELDTALLADLITGNLKSDIHKGRGSCGRITDIYYAALAPLIDRAIDDHHERHRIHTAFLILGDADRDMFEAFEEAGRYLQDEAKHVVALHASGDVDGARRRLAANYVEVARLQQAINESRTSLRDVQHTIVGN